MAEALDTEYRTDAVPVAPLTAEALPGWLETAGERERRWVTQTGFQAKPGEICLLPGADGTLTRVLAGIEDPDDPWCLGDLARALPPVSYRLECQWQTPALEAASAGWALGAYRFRGNGTDDEAPARLSMDPACESGRVLAEVRALALVRDLINTPANQMMPEHLADAIEQVGADHGATVRQTVGDSLLEAGYPAIHAVGRASAHAPRLVELEWGEPTRPRVTLVGKGVCFDSGGLDLKPSKAMRLMKKDMGGAAHALGLARLIMDAGLDVHLRLLVPAVENAVSGNAFRPGDVVQTRRGLSVEIDNTDAEGRVVLCDALDDAVDREPALLVDFATLTGAARVALGTEVPALFTNQDTLAADVLAHADRLRDPVWRLPLHAPYRALIDSKVADIANGSQAPYAGAITAALFLQAFVPQTVPWAHLDVMAWNTRARPGRPEGGEAMGVRAMFAHIASRFAG